MAEKIERLPAALRLPSDVPNDWCSKANLAFTTINISICIESTAKIIYRAPPALFHSRGMFVASRPFLCLLRSHK